MSLCRIRIQVNKFLELDPNPNYLNWIRNTGENQTPQPLLIFTSMFVMLFVFCMNLRLLDNPLSLKGVKKSTKKNLKPWKLGAVIGIFFSLQFWINYLTLTNRDRSSQQNPSKSVFIELKQKSLVTYNAIMTNGLIYDLTILSGTYMYHTESYWRWLTVLCIKKICWNWL